MIYHLWYLYTYIAFLITLPVLRIVASKINGDLIKYLTIIYFGFRCLIPLTELFFFNDRVHLNGNLSASPLIMDIFFLPLIGYYLENSEFIKRFSKRKMLTLWAINIICIMVSMYATKLVQGLYGNYGDMIQKFIPAFAALNAITIYATIKKITPLKEDDKHHRLNNLLVSLGDLTFGIYIIHLMPMRAIITNGAFNEYYNDQVFVIKILLWIALSFAVFIISSAMTWLLKKTPVLKRWL